MKKLFFSLIKLASTLSAIAQAPEKIKYQAVVRDANNELVSSQTIGMRISILQDSITGNLVYVETQNPTTNSLGLISLEIGSGTVVSGDFGVIDWHNHDYFLKMETDLSLIHI